MKARTKLQKEVTQLSGYLYSIGTEIKEWAYKHCLEHKGYANKSSAFCLDCGNTFSLDIINRKRATCPHCNTKLKIETTRCTTWKQEEYYAVTEVVDDFQVVRNFVLYSYHKKGKPVKHCTYEILQYWISPNGKVTMIGLKHTLNWHCDAWNGDFEIRVETKSWYNNNKYAVYPYKYHPSSVFKPEYAMYGIGCNLYSGMNVLDAIKLLPNNPKAETLLKAKQYSLVDRCKNYNYRDITNYWASIKICLRNRYKVKDASMYIDYLDLLRHFSKDLRNAKYVCPKNLKKQHDRYVKKKQDHDRKQELIKQKERIIADQEVYIREKENFFHLSFSSGLIEVKVIDHVVKFFEEGYELNHCVYTNRYYEKNHLLILSATINSKRIETVAVNLKYYSVEQSRGYENKASKYHEQIVSLVERNMNKIAAAHKKKSKNKNQLLKQVS